MILVINYSHVDVDQANKLLRWIGFLSEKNGNSMLNESIIVAGSRRATQFKSHKEICWLAQRIFGEARCFVPETEYEVGWPGSPNWMFRQCLEHVEKNFRDDVFFLEPDAIPIGPEWWDTFKSLWVEAVELGKTFMGARVEWDIPHMTGVAAYGRNWRSVAPSLAECPDNNAWDVFSAPQVLPHAHLIPQIQHVFNRHQPGWRVPGLAILDPRAVIFHQDKKGDIIRLLDESRYQGECAAHPLFSYVPKKDEDQMTKFYTTENATKVVKVLGKAFAFDPLQQFGGSIPGVLTLDNEADQVAMASAVANPASGVMEITQTEWEALTKKVWGVPNTSTYGVSKDRLPALPITQTPSKSPALLVEDPATQRSDTLVAQGDSPLKGIDDVLNVATVSPAQHATPSKRPRKPQQSVKG